MPDHVHHVIDKEPEPPRRCACRNSTVSTCGGSVLQQACAAYRTRVCSVHSNTQHATPQHTTRNTATPMRMPPLHTVHVLPPVHVNVPVHRIHWRSCSDARNTSPPKLPPSSNEAHWLVGLRLRACLLSDSAVAEQHTCAQALTPAHAPVNPGQPVPLAYPAWAVSGVWDYTSFFTCFSRRHSAAAELIHGIAALTAAIVLPSSVSVALCFSRSCCPCRSKQARHLPSTTLPAAAAPCRSRPPLPSDPLQPTPPSPAPSTRKAHSSPPHSRQSAPRTSTPPPKTPPARARRPPTPPPSPRPA